VAWKFRFLNRILNPAGKGSELHIAYLWDVISIRIAIETAGEELISARPLPGAPTVGAESSPDTN
jgi:hypothetical protein